MKAIGWFLFGFGSGILCIRDAPLLASILPPWAAGIGALGVIIWAVAAMRSMPKGN